MVALSASGTGRIVVLPDPYSMIASKIRSQDSDTRFAFKIHIQDSLSRFVFKLMPSSMNECMQRGASSVSFRWPMKGVLLGTDAGVAFWCPMKGVLLEADEVSPPGDL